MTTSPRRPAGFLARYARSPAARVVLWANLAAQVLIVVTGGIVRLTGSGLGCSTWPQCEPGQFTPALREATSWHPYIEFGNRTMTGVLAALALATAAVVWPRRDRSRSLRLLGLVPIAGVVVQAVVGGMTVLWELHPGFVSVHFLLSMVLVAASTALLIRHAEGDGPPRPKDAAARNLAWALIPVLAVVLVLGVITTGSGPHSGDAEVGYRFGLDPVTISRVHAGAVWVYLIGVLALVALAWRRHHPEVRGAVVGLLAVTLAQGLVGYLQYFTGLPEVLVGVHMLGASLLVAAHVVALLALRERAARAATPPPAAAARSVPKEPAAA